MGVSDRLQTCRDVILRGAQTTRQLPRDSNRRTRTVLIRLCLWFTSQGRVQHVLAVQRHACGDTYRCASAYDRWRQIHLRYASNTVLWSRPADRRPRPPLYNTRPLKETLTSTSCRRGGI